MPPVHKRGASGLFPPISPAGDSYTIGGPTWATKLELFRFRSVIADNPERFGVDDTLAAVTLVEIVVPFDFGWLNNAAVRVAGIKTPV